MTTIAASADHCTVIVTVDADPAVMVDLEPHARDGLRWFSDYEGFVSGALHKSADGTRLIQYLQWRTEEHHLACMNDPAWQEVPSARRFTELVESGRASIDVRIYDVVAASAAPDAHTWRS